MVRLPLSSSLLLVPFKFRTSLCASQILNLNTLAIIFIKMNEILFLLTSIRSSRYCRYALYSSSSTSLISKVLKSQRPPLLLLLPPLLLLLLLLLRLLYSWRKEEAFRSCCLAGGSVGSRLDRVYVESFPRSQSISALETTSPIKSKKNQGSSAKSLSGTNKACTFAKHMRGPTRLLHTPRQSTGC